LCYRGLGELDVAITHSIGVVLCGYVFLGGHWNHSLPWLLSLPLLLAILPSIILSGIPDMEADAQASKRTAAVLLGQRGALILALAFTVLSAAAALAGQILGLANGALGGMAYAAIPHGALLVWLLCRRMASGKAPGRIDGLMIASLTYLLWFALIPMLRLAG
ncbi:MAG: UbiA family prenyltransferase, partial [Gemmatimonadaceae bacterium]